MKRWAIGFWFVLLYVSFTATMCFWRNWYTTDLENDLLRDRIQRLEGAVEYPDLPMKRLLTKEKTPEPKTRLGAAFTPVRPAKPPEHPIEVEPPQLRMAELDASPMNVSAMYGDLCRMFSRESAAYLTWLYFQAIPEVPEALKAEGVLFQSKETDPEIVHEWIINIVGEEGYLRLMEAAAPPENLADVELAKFGLRARPIYGFNQWRRKGK